MTREEAQPAWEVIVDIGCTSYSTLSRAQRVWFNVEPLATGGIIDHYVNHGAEHTQDTIDDLDYLGYREVADLLRRVNSLFEKGTPPFDINERNEEMASWPDEKVEILDEVEDAFWATSGKLEAAMLHHIQRTGIGAV
jgi:hypothetical protein